MSSSIAKLRSTLAYSLLAGGLVLAAASGPALAGEQPPFADQIIKALKPKPLTRSLTISPDESERNAAEEQFLDRLRHKTPHSLTLDERQKLAKFAQDKPSFAIEIDFEYNSAKLSPSTMPTVRELGKALSSADLKGSTFVVEGHTDAKGSARYNQRLSQRRADAVKRFVVEQYRIPAADLVAVGYGKTNLRNKDDPFAAENRRVLVVNMANNVAIK